MSHVASIVEAELNELGQRRGTKGRIVAAVGTATVKARIEANQAARRAAEFEEKADKFEKKAAKFDRRSKERRSSTIARAVDDALDHRCQTAREVFAWIRKSPVVVSVNDMTKSFVWRDHRRIEQEMKRHSFENLLTKRKKRRPGWKKCRRQK